MIVLAALGAWTAPLVIVALSLIVSAGATWAAWRRKAEPPRPVLVAPPISPVEAAFDAVARASGLGDEDRAVVRALAGAHGDAHPVALLISSHAFDTARRRLPPTAPVELRRAAGAIRTRLFAGA
ncbi:MAG: hypothetical protein IBJ10_07640 [Phycisphaerales bacterium]|nr:hypothetical protein [Phycisphaerales bacterium]